MAKKARKKFTRFRGDHRKNQILQEALRIVAKFGLYTERLTFSEIARRCGCSRSNIKHHWKSLQAIRGALIAQSFKGEDRSIFNQALAKHDPVAVSLQNNDTA